MPYVYYPFYNRVRVYVNKYSSQNPNFIFKDDRLYFNLTRFVGYRELSCVFKRVYSGDVHNWRAADVLFDDALENYAEDILIDVTSALSDDAPKFFIFFNDLDYNTVFLDRDLTLNFRKDLLKPDMLPEVELTSWRDLSSVITTNHPGCLKTEMQTKRHRKTELFIEVHPERHRKKTWNTIAPKLNLKFFRIRYITKRRVGPWCYYSIKKNNGKKFGSMNNRPVRIYPK